MLPRLIRYFKEPLSTNSFCKEMKLFFLLSFLADVWASHPQAPASGRFVAPFNNYHRMENPDIPLDENTKSVLRFTVELGCRGYARHHSIKRYESKAIASRVYFSSLESALQMFFPGCKIVTLEENSQKHSSITSSTLPYVVTTAGKYGTGFYTNIISPRIWIRFNSSQPKASAHLRVFVERNSKHFDILRLRGIQRRFLATIISAPDLVEGVIGNDISTLQTVFRYAIAHTVQRAHSATTPELYKEAIYNGLSSHFPEFELRQYVFSPNVSYVAKAPEFTVYRSNFPLMLYTNESKLRFKGCIPLHVDLRGPSKMMGMIVASFSRQVFAIYFKSVNMKALGVVRDLLHHFADKLKDFDLKKQDRFFELFEKKPVD